MGRRKSLIIFFVLFFSPVLFSDFLINQPEYGEDLEILITDSNDKSISIIDPDGERVELETGDEQIYVNMDKTGRWIVLHGEQIREVEISRRERIGLDLIDKSVSEQMFFTPFIATVAISSILAMIAAIYFFLFRYGDRKRPVFRKVRENGYVKVILKAGSRPLKDVRIEDSVGKEWTHRPLSMSKKTLEPFKSLELSYVYSGPMCEAVCRFYEDEKFVVLDTEDGGKKIEKEPKIRRLSRV